MTLNDLERLVKFLVYKQAVPVLPTPINQMRYLSKYTLWRQLRRVL